MAKYSTREASNNPHQKNYPIQDFYSRYVKNLKPVGNGQLRPGGMSSAATTASSASITPKNKRMKVGGGGVGANHTVPAQIKD